MSVFSSFPILILPYISVYHQSSQVFKTNHIAAPSTSTRALPRWAGSRCRSCTGYAQWAWRARPSTRSSARSATSRYASPAPCYLARPSSPRCGRRAPPRSSSRPRLRRRAAWLSPALRPNSLAAETAGSCESAWEKGLAGCGYGWGI